MVSGNVAARAPITRRASALCALLLSVWVGTACESLRDLFGPGSPAHLVVVSGDSQTGTVAAPLGSPIIVKVTDESGEAVSSVRVNWTTSSGAGSVSSVETRTDKAGLAQVTWQLGTVAGPQGLTATASGLSGSPAQFAATARAGSPAMLLQVAGDNQTGTVAQPLPAPLVVRVVDLHGNGVPDVSVTFAGPTGGNAATVVTLPTAADGRAQTVWTLGNASGPNPIMATVANLSGSPVHFAATAHAGAPASLVAVSGINQTGTVAAALPAPIVVRVADAFGNGVAGATVTFVGSGGANLTPATATTTEDGLAQTLWTLGTSAGAVSATASVASLAAFQFAATAGPGSPTSLEYVSGNNQSGSMASPLPAPLVVRVTDVYGNVTPGVPVSFAVSSGGGSMAAASVPTDAAGRAQTIWTLGATAATQSATASVPGMSGAPVLFTASVLAAHELAVTISGLPLGASGDVTVSGPAGFSSKLLSTRTLTGLVAGTYTITAASVNPGGVLYTPTPPSQTRTVTATASATATVTYAPVASALNLTIDGLYLTQSTQTYHGAVPLVADRAAYLRVFLKANDPNTVAPAVRVRLYLDGALMDTRTIGAPANSVPTSIAEGDQSSSWNLTLPASLIQPGLAIVADVDPTNVVSESNEKDNTFPASGTPLNFDVRTVPPFNVTFVPVLQSGNGLLGDVTTSNVDSYVAFAQRVFPFSTYTTALRATYTFNGVLSTDNNDLSWSLLLSQLNALRVAEGSGRFYYGVIRRSFSSGVAGLGYRPGYAAVGWDNVNGRGPVAAHEWGHNFGRMHVGCGGPANVDPAYPYANGRIGVSGFDLTSSSLRAPSSYVDLMSYCSPEWISDYTYTAVMAFRQATGASVSSGTSQRSLLVWGRVENDEVILEPAFEITAPAVLPARAGPFSVEALDAAGRRIFNIAFEGDAVDHMEGVRHFAFAVPLTGAAVELPTTLRLRGNGREAVRRRPSTPPVAAVAGTVRVRATSAGRLRVEWDAAAYPSAMVRDAATGEILSFARGGAADIAAAGAELDVVLSDGIGSVRRRVAVPR